MVREARFLWSDPYAPRPGFATGWDDLDTWDDLPASASQKKRPATHRRLKPTPQRGLAGADAERPPRTKDQ